MRTIAFLNQKGGTGKTTSVLNVGSGLTKLGKKVLLVDMDPQASLTQSLGIKPYELGKTVYEVLKEEIKAKEVFLQVEGMTLLPASLSLSGADYELTREPGAEGLLKEALGDLRGFDFCLVDCPPSLGVLTVVSLSFVKEVYVALQVEFLALQGIAQLLETVEKIRRRLNKHLKITGVIGTRFDQRRNLNKAVVEKIKEHFKDTLFKTLIRENIAIAEAPSVGKSIFEYKPSSTGAEDYQALCKEILKRG